MSMITELALFLSDRYGEEDEYCTTMETAAKRVAERKAIPSDSMLAMIGATLSDPDILTEMARWSRMGLNPPNNLDRVQASTKAKREVVSLVLADPDARFAIPILRVLAVPYQDHRDFQQEWLNEADSAQ